MALYNDIWVLLGDESLSRLRWNVSASAWLHYLLSPLIAVCCGSRRRVIATNHSQTPTTVTFNTRLLYSCITSYSVIAQG